MLVTTSRDLSFGMVHRPATRLNVLLTVLVLDDVYSNQRANNKSTSRHIPMEKITKDQHTVHCSRLLKLFTNDSVFDAWVEEDRALSGHPLRLAHVLLLIISVVLLLLISVVLLLVTSVVLLLVISVVLLLVTSVVLLLVISVVLLLVTSVVLLLVTSVVLLLVISVVGWKAHLVSELDQSTPCQPTSCHEGSCRQLVSFLLH